MTPLEKKLIDAYTILAMADEVDLEDVPGTIISTGETLRNEVELEKARRTVGNVSEPVDHQILSRLGELENNVEEQSTVTEELRGNQSIQDAVIEEVLFDIIPILGGLGGE